jgi:Methyltransferase domain
MIAALVPTNGAYAEIGVFEGTFSKTLVRLLNPSRIYLIDLFEGNMVSGDQDGNGVVCRNLADTYRDMTDFASNASNVIILKGDSSTVLYGLPDSSLDMVYIDGDHGYEGCMLDLRAAFAKVKTGGWIMGHDYEMNMAKARTMYTFGVKKAVDEFCQTFNQTISAKGLDGCVSYAIQLVK